MKKFKKIILIIIAIISLLTIIQPLTEAKFLYAENQNFIIGRVGNAGRSGGGTSGGSSRGSSRSNSFNSSSSNRSSSSSSNTYSSSGDLNWLDFMILFRLLGNGLPVILILLFLYYIKNKNHVKSTKSEPMYSNVVHRNIEQEIQLHDPDFDESKFITHVQKSYLIVTNAWSSLDMTKATQYITPDYADTLNIQLQEFIRNKTKNMNEAVEFLSTKLIDYNNDGAMETVTVEIYLSDIDYIVDNNNQLIEGSKQRQYVTLTIEMMRKVGAKTKVFQTDTHCPSCHAPMKLDLSGKCAYCDTMYQVDQDNWLINDIKAY